MEERKIVAVRESAGFLESALAENLKANGFAVAECPAKISEISAVSSGADAVALFVDSALSEKQEVLVYLKDLVIESDIPLFLLEVSEGLDEVRKAIPDSAVTNTFRRPLEVKAAAQSIRDFVDQYGKRSKKKILVVDDSGAMLRNLKAWLGDKYHVIPANSGAMAIKYLSTDRPDLVLLDYEMPVVNGRQVLEMIRTESEFSQIPVIFLTGRNDREGILEVMALKPQGYLLKTMPPAEIVRNVDEFFAKAENQEKQERAKG